MRSGPATPGDADALASILPCRIGAAEEDRSVSGGPVAGNGTPEMWCFRANAGKRAFHARAGSAGAGRMAGDNDEGLPDLRLAWRRTT